MNFLPAVIDGEGRARLEGDLVPWPLLRWDLPEGTGIEIAFRPAAAQPTPDSNQGGMLPFAAEMVEDLGTELHLHGTAAGTAIAIALPATAELPSQPYTIAVADDAVHAFIAQDGRRAEPQRI